MSLQDLDNTSASRFRILKSEDEGRCATYEFDDEDHTLGNALRHIILKNPDVKFCGYALPHPNERKINLQIQVFSGEAIDVLEKGLKDLIDLNRVVREAIQEEGERFGPVELIDSEEDEEVQDGDDEEAGDQDGQEEGHEESGDASKQTDDEMRD